MPTINEIMQYAFGKKNTKPLSINKDFINVNPNDNIFTEQQTSPYMQNILKREFSKGNRVGINNMFREKEEPYLKIDVPEILKRKNIGLNNEQINEINMKIQNNERRLSDSGTDITDIFDDILKYNNKLKNRTNLLHGARTATNLGVLLSNILQPEGDGLPTQVNLTRPDLQYDDTIRRKMINEAGQQSNIAQMNAMKLGMREAIPSINANMMRATNDVNTQAQANINEIQQKNAMLASEIANKEIEANLTLNEKRIQDALMKNELRNKAISGQTDTTFRDLGKWQQQSELINQENNKANIYKYMAKNPSNAVNNLLKSYFGTDAFDDKKKRKYDDEKKRKYDDEDVE